VEPTASDSDEGIPTEGVDQSLDQLIQKNWCSRYNWQVFW